LKPPRNLRVASGYANCIFNEHVMTVVIDYRGARRRYAPLHSGHAIYILPYYYKHDHFGQEIIKCGYIY